jgi:hypothetical protein
MYTGDVGLEVSSTPPHVSIETLLGSYGRILDEFAHTWLREPAEFLKFNDITSRLERITGGASEDEKNYHYIMQTL